MTATRKTKSVEYVCSIERDEGHLSGGAEYMNRLSDREEISVARNVTENRWRKLD